MKRKSKGGAGWAASFKGTKRIWAVKGLGGHVLMGLYVVLFAVLMLGFYSFFAGVGMILMNDAEVSRLVTAVISLAGAVVLLLLYALVTRLVEKQWPADIKMQDCLRGALTGVFLGVSIFVVTTLILLLSGHCTIDAMPTRLTGDQWLMHGVNLVFFLLVGTGEEIAFRGIVFRVIDGKWGTWMAFIVSGLLFGFVHIGNAGATVLSSLAIAIEAGVILGLAYKLTGTLWTAIAIHWVWNYMEGPVLGFPVSGTDFGTPMFVSDTNGPDLVTGGPFGPEASLVMVGVSLLVCLVFWLCWRRKS